ncbi:Lrp/AsnC family transcriptional regulator [Thermococcus sp. 2319x1]|uniref:Lrp/AsnC family transcriptional regulator n=1 Tax=Thermococcus sp. 2319x1 TaxID=1674923 RepID=UPI001581F125|nr:Lrp/AsnC family transcriptional regulator [Thermococcus sp. 2319x1]
MKRRLSKKDWQIIKLLKENARMSDAEIGRRIGLSKSAVRWRRINLQKNGRLFISAYLRFDKIGYNYAFILIKLKPEASKEQVISFKKKLMEHEHTFEVYEIWGDYDLLVGVFGEDTSDLRKTVMEILQEENCIHDYKIIFGIKTLKGLEVPFRDVLPEL